jgi:hypothetical protein
MFAIFSRIALNLFARRPHHLVEVVGGRRGFIEVFQLFDPFGGVVISPEMLGQELAGITNDSPLLRSLM